MRDFEDFLIDCEDVFLCNKCDFAKNLGVCYRTTLEWSRGAYKRPVNCHQARYTKNALASAERRIQELQDFATRLKADLADSTIPTLPGFDGEEANIEPTE